jgi:hypothetical protein
MFSGILSAARLMLFQSSQAVVSRQACPKIYLIATTTDLFNSHPITKIDELTKRLPNDVSASYLSIAIGTNHGVVLFTDGKRLLGHGDRRGRRDGPAGALRGDAKGSLKLSISAPGKLGGQSHLVINSRAKRGSP